MGKHNRHNQQSKADLCSPVKQEAVVETPKVEVVKELVKRKDYADLVNFVKENQHLETPEAVKSHYEKAFGKRFTNIARLIKRSLRDESPNMEANLKNAGLTMEEYLAITKKFIQYSNGKSTKLVEVEVAKTQ